MRFPYIFDMVHPNPGEEEVDSEFNRPAFLASGGYNGMVPHLYIQCAVTYDSLTGDASPPAGSEARKWIHEKAASLDGILEEAASHGIGVHPFTDFMVVPAAVWDEYGREMAKEETLESAPDDGVVAGMSGCEGQGIAPDIHRETTRRVIAAQLREIFDRFPTLGGLMVRFGETYLHSAPHHVGGTPFPRTAEGISGHIALLNILREEVCVKRNKKIFYRTWDFGNNFHVNPDYYLEVTGRVRPHPNLVFSIKHTEGDFRRSTPFNPTIGIGRHPQIIEIQCQREYEGKGAHPSYPAHGVINGFEELPVLQDAARPMCLRDIRENDIVQGIWPWSRGGGWEGPVIANEFWIRLNAYVLSRWAQDPHRPEEELFNAFAAEHGIAGASLSAFRKLCLLSEKGVLLGQMSEHHAPYMLWTRDEYFGVPPDEDLLPVVVLEKSEAARIWKSIETLSNEIETGSPDLTRFLRVSCTYGRIKFDIIHSLWQLARLDLQARNGHEIDKREAARHAALYLEKFEEWEELAKDPLCSSIYVKFRVERTRAKSPRELIEAYLV